MSALSRQASARSTAHSTCLDCTALRVLQGLDLLPEDAPSFSGSADSIYRDLEPVDQLRGLHIPVLVASSFSLAEVTFGHVCVHARSLLDAKLDRERLKNATAKTNGKKLVEDDDGNPRKGRQLAVVKSTADLIDHRLPDQTLILGSRRPPRPSRVEVVKFSERLKRDGMLALHTHLWPNDHFGLSTFAAFDPHRTGVDAEPLRFRISPEADQSTAFDEIRRITALVGDLAAKDFRVLVGDTALSTKVLSWSIRHDVSTSQPDQVLRFYLDALRQVLPAAEVIQPPGSRELVLIADLGADVRVTLAPHKKDRLRFRVDVRGPTAGLLFDDSIEVSEVERLQAFARPFFQALWRAQVRAAWALEGDASGFPARPRVTAQEFTERIAPVLKRRDTAAKYATLLRRLAADLNVPRRDAEVDDEISGFGRRQITRLSELGLIEIASGSADGRTRWVRLRDPYLGFLRSEEGRAVLDDLLQATPGAPGADPGNTRYGDVVLAKDAQVRASYALPDGRVCRVLRQDRRVTVRIGDDEVELHWATPLFELVVLGPIQAEITRPADPPLADPDRFSRAVIAVLRGVEVKRRINLKRRRRGARDPELKRFSIEQIDSAFTQSMRAEVARRYFAFGEMKGDIEKGRRKSSVRYRKLESASRSQGFGVLVARLRMLLSELVVRGEVMTDGSRWWIGKASRNMSSRSISSELIRDDADDQGEGD